jgi:monothiol glutaredoxin
MDFIVMSNVIERIKQQIQSDRVVIYMKGTPDNPHCGFSQKAVQVLLSTKHPFTYFDVLDDVELLNNLPQYSNWPTFPQIYIDGALIGGCDIIVSMYRSGELQNLLETTTCAKK